MKKYYLNDGAEQTGPFDVDELKPKGVTKGTQIWCEGMSEWSVAGKVEELSSPFTAAPPPSPPPSPPPPPPPFINNDQTQIHPK